MEIQIWLNYSFKTTWSSRQSRLRSCFVQFLFLFQVVANNIGAKIKMDRGKNNTRFPEGKAGYLERENEIMLAADWEMLFWRVGGPCEATPALLLSLELSWATTGLSSSYGSSRFTSQCQNPVPGKREFQYLWGRAETGNVNRSNDLCPASCCLH